MFSIENFADELNKKSGLKWEMQSRCYQGEPNEHIVFRAENGFRIVLNVNVVDYQNRSKSRIRILWPNHHESKRHRCCGNSFYGRFGDVPGVPYNAKEPMIKFNPAKSKTATVAKRVVSEIMTDEFVKAFMALEDHWRKIKRDETEGKQWADRVTEALKGESGRLPDWAKDFIPYGTMPGGSIYIWLPEDTETAIKVVKAIKAAMGE